MKRLLCCLGIMLITAACSEGIRYSYISENDFLQSIPLSRHAGFDFAYRISGIAAFDSATVIHADRDTALFSVYGRNNDFRYAWGNRGRAAGEYIMPMMMKTPSGELGIFDIAKGRLEYYEAGEASVKMNRKYNLDGITGAIRSVHYAGGDTLLLEQMQPDGITIYKWHPECGAAKIRTMDEYNSLYASSAAYAGFMASDSASHRFVYAFQYIDGFDIYDMQGKCIKRIRRESFGHPGMARDGHDLADAASYCFGAACSENGFLVYRAGWSGNELMENMHRRTAIEEFDWDGTPLKRYELPTFIAYFDYIGGGSFVVQDYTSEDEPMQIMH